MKQNLVNSRWSVGSVILTLILVASSCGRNTDEATSVQSAEAPEVTTTDVAGTTVSEDEQPAPEFTESIQVKVDPVPLGGRILVEPEGNVGAYFTLERWNGSDWEAIVSAVFSASVNGVGGYVPLNTDYDRSDVGFSGTQAVPVPDIAVVGVYRICELDNTTKCCRVTIVPAS